eukprot:414352_1
MGNETSDSSSTSLSSPHEEVLHIQEQQQSGASMYCPSFYSGIYGMYCMKYRVASKAIEEPLIFKNYTFIPFGHFNVTMYISHFERIYALDIGNPITEMCCSYFGNIIECFDSERRGPRCVLKDSNTVCTLSQNGSNTAYGSMSIQSFTEKTECIYWY